MTASMLFASIRHVGCVEAPLPTLGGRYSYLAMTATKLPVTPEGHSLLPTLGGRYSYLAIM